jgi:flagellar biosynthesis anti-sigma factor FlgM
MGIDGIQGKRDKLQIEQHYGQQSNAGNRSKPSSADQDDKVQISNETQEFLRIRSLVDATPDIRQDLVAELRRQIAQGTYEVSSSDIADAILDTWM